MWNNAVTVCLGLLSPIVHKTKGAEAKIMV